MYVVKEERCLYTQNGGWIDMVHFLFYAGRVYENKKNGKENPIGKAAQEVYQQERFDPVQSAFRAYPKTRKG